MKKTILIILVLAAAVGGCKKYEEGPLISFRSAESRIYGKHEIKSITVDGEERLNEYLDSLTRYFDFYYVEDVGNVCHIDGVRNDGTYTSMHSTWSLKNHNKQYKTTTSWGFPHTVCFGPIKGLVYPEWEILRLTNTEFKMKTNYEGKEYVLDLEKK
jgi:hypothetical protein